MTIIYKFGTALVSQIAWGKLSNVLIIKWHLKEYMQCVYNHFITRGGNIAKAFNATKFCVQSNFKSWIWTTNGLQND